MQHEKNYDGLSKILIELGDERNYIERKVHNKDDPMELSPFGPQDEAADAEGGGPQDGDYGDYSPCEWAEWHASEVSRMQEEINYLGMQRQRQVR